MAAQYWVMLIVAGMTSAGVLGTLWQRRRSEQIDRILNADHEARTEWWRRFQWAAELVHTGQSARAETFGLRILTALSTSPLITDSERPIVREIAAISRRRNNETGKKRGGR